jgi:hypothetical protein
MQRGLVVLICLVLLSTPGCASYSHSRAAKRAESNAARLVAQQWLELVDAGDYEQAFERKALRFRASGTQAQFARSMQGRRELFGKVVSRKFIGAASMKKLVGLPDGKYETILFKTDFENKSAAAERVILTKEGGHRQVVDYRIY